MQAYIEQVTDGDNLTQEEARAAATAVFEEATEAQIGALLAALRAKGETETEIAGFAQGMRDAARRIAPTRRPLVDTCGTGGDAHDTINVSTSAAIVTSGAGVAVAKHGNYSVSSSSGSADVLEALGVTVDAEPEDVERSIDEHGIGFMLAPVFHPAMKAVIGPRKDLGMRTIFNVLGPLTNPAGAHAQTVGVYDPELVPIVARAMARMEVKRALVVHGSGLDEIAVHGETTVAEVDGDRIEEYSLTPEELGLDRHPIEAIAGGTPEENATDLRGILDDKIDGAKLDVVLANAGAAVYVGGAADTIEDGVARARKAVADGDASAKLAALQQVAATR